MRINTNGKIIIAVVAAVLVCLLLVALLGNAFGLFTKDIGDISLRERNEKNLILSEDITLTKFNDGNGVNATAEEDGRVKLRGTNDTSGDIKIPYATVTIEKAGEYTLWDYSKSDNPNGSNTTYHVVAEYNGTSYVANFSNNKITVSDNATVTLYIVVKPDASVNTTLYPVLCAGTERVDFYA